MSTYYARIKKYYDLKIYNKKKVADFVLKQIITAEEYVMIVGEPM